ncbi:GDP-L-fucose synthase family protein [Chitinophaga sp. 22536]|uniref:GDP-L-fucose synthase family protein n=1 Tax=unclassified Chitinophaga TaxID=2619133 RepID=UPI003F85B820
MEKSDKIFVAGHRGLVGSAITRRLEYLGYSNLILKSSTQLDLRDKQQVESFFLQEKPAYVFLSAAKVGGIIANDTRPGEFIYDNLMIQSNTIHEAYKAGVKKLLFLGSSCIYPKLAPQPMKEEYILTGKLEPTNEAYAVAKIAGIEMCKAYRKQYNCNFISVMPTNLYGPNDNYDLKNSHVMPALLRKMHEAKVKGLPFVEIWGTGSPKREFMHADDLADACIFLMKNYNGEQLVNIGVGEDLSIAELANLIKEIVGYTGDLKFDHSKPDGTPRKLMDVSFLHNLGWKHNISLRNGITEIYNAKKSEWS